MKNWIRLALRPSIVRRAINVSLVVGSILTVINQGQVIVSGAITLAIAAKILLTYCVPYCVSTYASVAALADQGEG